MSNTATKFFTESEPITQRSPVSDQSGVRSRPTPDGHLVGESIYVRDHEVRVVPCLNETDMMVYLITHCPFLSYKDYQAEVSDYIFSHFEQVFTFDPKSGRAALHTR